MLQTRLLQVVSMSVTLAIALPAVAAEVLKGSRFITVMKGNTLSGATDAGAEFNLYFVEGGRVTYEDSAGERDDGMLLQPVAFAPGALVPSGDSRLSGLVKLLEARPGLALVLRAARAFEQVAPIVLPTL